MKPFCRIIGGGKDITGGLGDRLMNVEVADEAEDKSDKLTLTIDDRQRFEDAGVIDVPLIGFEVEIIMGYTDGGASRSMGRYLIDELTVDSPPSTLTVSGRSANMPSKFRTPRTESYHQETIGAIVEKVAGRNGFSASVDPAIAGVVVRHADQNGESDMAFVNRLAGQHDAVAKPVSGRLVLAKKGTGKTVSGAELPPVSVAPSDCSRWRFNYSARDEAGEAGKTAGGGAPSASQKTAGDSRLPAVTQFESEAGRTPAGPGPGPAEKGGVRAFWNDIRTGERKEVTVGQEPFHDIRYTHHNEAEARAAASSYRNKAARGKAAFECTIGGRPSVQAEATLTLVGFRPYVPTKWRIKSARHSFEPGGGYSTAISAELFDDKQDDTAAGVKKTKAGKDDKVDKSAPSENVVQFTTGGGEKTPAK